MDRLMRFPMEELVVSGNLADTLRRRIAVGGDPNGISHDGIPFICLAVSTRNNDDVIKVLLEEGAKVDEKCKNGRSTFSVAAENDNLGALEILFQYGGMPSASDLNELIEGSTSKRITDYLVQMKRSQSK